MVTSTSTLSIPEPTRFYALSDVQFPTQKHALRLGTAIVKSDYFRHLNLRGEVFEGYRTASRQAWLFAHGKSQTPRSMHQLGLAIDMVLTQQDAKYIKKFIWNTNLLFGGIKYKIYEELVRLGVEIGFRSLGLTYNYDYYHFEIPIIFQGSSPHCYAYAIVNCIQKGDIKWRQETQLQCKAKAEKIASLIEQEKLPRSVESALSIAIRLGYIKGYTKQSPRDIEDYNILNKFNVVISQKNKNFQAPNSLTEWVIHKKNMEAGIGILNHATCLEEHIEGKLHCRNSHEPYPHYTIDTHKVKEAVQAFYFLEL